MDGDGTTLSASYNWEGEDRREDDKSAAPASGARTRFAVFMLYVCTKENDHVHVRIFLKM